MYRCMQDVLAPGRLGCARIEHFTLSPQQADTLAMESRDFSIRPGRFTRLYVRDQLVMSDTLMELESNWEVVCRASGRVLIAGLGLGVILVPILAKADVSHVTIVESEADVIALVAPAFKASVESDRLEIVHADIYSWLPQRGARYDTIYFDIWSAISVANLPGMARLHHRFARFVNHANPNAWMDSWQRARLLAERRLGTQPW